MTVLKKGDEEKTERKNQLLITEVGMDLKNVDYTDVWRNMLQFSLNKHEKADESRGSKTVLCPLHGTLSDRAGAGGL